MSIAAEAAEVRVLLSAASIDGSGNNLSNPDWGSAGEDFIRLTVAEYADSFSSVGGEDRPSAREISNAVADTGGENAISNRLLSAMIYAWGQFIDHDMTLTKSGSTELMSIPVPTGDPSFDPQSTGTKSINTFRSDFDPLSGTDALNPRQQINLVTAFLDGSMVYGSDAATAASLRTFSAGLMATSDGDLLPLENGFFKAGDVRVNENPELAALQTLFVREHNGQARRIAAANPTLKDEQIYQKARAVVIAEIQAITYNEWLPSLLGKGAIDGYSGYDPTVNPGISNEFSTAAFRLGHSLLGDDIEFLDNNGIAIADEVSLAEAFFNPDLVSDNGIDSILKYLASDPSSELDNEVVDSVRNFLFGPPGAGGLDLASLNVQRGRDHGLADYNAVRVAMGLPPATSWADITSDEELQADLESLYGSVDDVDLWVGGLAEDHVAGGSLGETFRTILVDQFGRLRAGDRYWYQNQFSGRELATLQQTSLSDIIERNSTLTTVQSNAFFFKAGISGSVNQDLNRDGKVSGNEPPMAKLTVQLINTEDNSVVATTATDHRGVYSFDVEDGLRTGVYKVRVTKADGTAVATSRDVAIQSGDDFENVSLAVPVPRSPAPQPPKKHGSGSKNFNTVAATSPKAAAANAVMSSTATESPGNRTANIVAGTSVRLTTANQITRINDRPKSPEASIVAAAGRTALATPVTSAGLNGGLLDALFSALPPGLL